jgi:TonB-linked SusC/RagA family outer membrane protein
MQRDATGKGWRAGKLLLIFLLFSIAVSAQKISLSLKNLPIEKVFKEIEHKTDFRFSYASEALEGTTPVTTEIKDEDIETALQKIFDGQPLTYSIDQHFILVRPKEKINPSSKESITVTGSVSNEKQEAIAGATVRVKNSMRAIATDGDGKFLLDGLQPSDILLVSSVGYVSEEVPVVGKTAVTIMLAIAVNKLDETIVIAYGTTTKRLNTGNVGRVTSEEIEKQPVSNVLGAIQGRVPGLLVTQTTGVPGGAFKIQIRGQNSLTQGSQPLFIIDGVPFASNNTSINRLNSATGVDGLSPFNSIDPSDIQSIEILKDADATAIYGSRGANGVVLITTKKGNVGKTEVKMNFASGISTVTRTMNMLDTKQYIQMRREAYKNDGATPSVSSAPDLLVWDTTKYTDFKELLIGNNANFTNANLSFSGGSTSTQFLLAGSLHHETTVFPGDMKDNRAAVHFDLRHESASKKLQLQLTSTYSRDKNDLTPSDPTSSINTTPNLPSLYDSTGKLNWVEKGNYFTNPLSFIYRSYSAATNNLLSNFQISYKPIPSLSIRLSAGYNNIAVEENNIYPLYSQNPAFAIGSREYGQKSINNWIVEPQAEYSSWALKGKIQILLGASFQKSENNSNYILANGYTNDGLLESLAAATSITAQSNFSQYKYDALFARVNYNFNNKYLLNLTARRDGSSRFGPNKQFANFGSVGGAWVFRDERSKTSTLKVLSFAKLRASYGLTGNDQIADYQYMESWRSTTAYQGNSLYPFNLPNADYRWELNRKLESALDLAFFRDKLFLSAGFYRNRSNNQLINYTLPTQTGFPNIFQNFDAELENSGLEFEVSYKTPIGKEFHWTGGLNITVPHNKLISFPGLSTSSYANIYVIGKSLTLQKGYDYLGVNSATGIFMFADIDKNGTISSPGDYIEIGNLDPVYFGGFSNNFSYKHFDFGFHLEYRNQLGKNYLASIYRSTSGPGAPLLNQPEEILKRWQTPGQNTSIQKFTTTSGTLARNALGYFVSSDAMYSDASYLRLKNISLYYTFPSQVFKDVVGSSLRLYLLGQNILTISKYRGSDPETQNLYRLPPLKTFTAGVQLSF